jgi:hypothetical protein
VEDPIDQLVDQSTVAIPERHVLTISPATKKREGLTASMTSSRIRAAMRDFRLGRLRLVAAVLAAVMTVAVSATCFTPQMSQAEKDCCAKMSNDCGRLGQAHECCRSEAPRVDQGSAVTRISLAPPAVTVIAALVRDLVVSLPTNADRERFSALSVKPPGLPTYLLVSSLRI